MITYELHNHDWYLCVDGRRCAKLLSPFHHSLVERAIAVHAEVAGDAVVQTILKLLEQETSAAGIVTSGVSPYVYPTAEEIDGGTAYAEMYSPELNSYVTPLAVQP